jgi:hypothetical protein
MFYTMDDAGDPVLCPDDDGRSGITHLAEWLMSRGTEDQGGLPQIAFDLLADGGYVSTIFLTIDASIFGPPRLFETMAFDGKGGIYPVTQRYVTRAEALRGHAEIVEALKRPKVIAALRRVMADDK